MLAPAGRGALEAFSGCISICLWWLLLSRSIMSDPLQPHGLQHTRLPCPSLSPGVFNHLILCHPLLLLPSVFPSIRSFPVSWLFASSGQSIGVSASVLAVNIQGSFIICLVKLNFFSCSSSSSFSYLPSSFFKQT